MLNVTYHHQTEAGGQVAIEENLSHAPTVGLFSGLKIIDVVIANRNGRHYDWHFRFPETRETVPHGVVLLETSEIMLFEGVELDPWLNFIISNIQKQLVRCTFTDYAESGVFPDSSLIELLYVDLLGRGVDPAGMQSYILARADNRSWESIRSDLVGSQEFADRILTIFDRIGRVFQFQTLTTEAMKRTDIDVRGVFDVMRYEDLSHEDFCRTAYQKVLNKKPDKAGLSFYVWALNTGRLTRRNAVRRMLGDAKQEQSFMVPPVPQERAEIVLEIPPLTSAPEALRRIQQQLGITIAENIQASWLNGEMTLDALADSINGSWDSFFSRLKLIEVDK